jgi:hypothetical protein
MAFVLFFFGILPVLKQENGISDTGLYRNGLGTVVFFNLNVNST